jgi:spermidine synthase
VHLPASYVPEVRDVLILGGGTLFAAAEALKYRSAKRVILVDHDPEVTEVVARYYQHAKRCIKDPRFQLLSKDAYDDWSAFHQKFDLVINDGIDLLNLNENGAKGEHSVDVFESMSSVLRAEGVCSDVIQRHIFERSRTLQTLSRLRKRSRVALSLVLLPEYHGVLHMLSVWGKASSSVTQEARRPTNAEQMGWIRTPARNPCTYYDPRFLGYYLYLPHYLKEALSFKKRAV